MAVLDSDKDSDIVEEAPRRSQGSWLASNVLWGGLILLVGLLLLFSNLGLVDIQWDEAWRLWPILIILAGLSILSLKGWVAIVVYSLAALVIVALVWATLMGAISYQNGRGQTETFTVEKENDDIKNFTLDITGGPGSLSISSTSSSNVTEGESRGMHTDFNSEVTSNGETQTVKLSQSRDGGWFMPGSVSDLDIRINKSLPTDLEIEAGASDINADLADIKLRSLIIDSGASSINLKLGDELSASDVTLKTGASSVVVQVPESSGVKLKFDAGLSSKDLPDGYRQINDTTYESSNYSEADNKIAIDVDMGVSSFDLKTY